MTSKTINYEGIEEFDLANYCEDAYLNYALYVIKDRALPFIGDGLKPVQRRIVYTMAIESINAPAKKKKSAYTVGQVLGRFHPHGDMACYEAMVIMTQDFNYRYPLISGQGNFGDLFNPKGFAAMRYTESFLSPYSLSLLDELNSGNVEFIPNYNGDEKEPDYLPAQIPNILLNGTTGIAVGMATDIPPHNVNEVIDACCALIDNPNLTIPQLMEYVKGPDYPGKAQIINSTEELLEIYSTGSGKIRQRAVWKQEKDQIIISELPYQSAPSLIVKVAELMQAKKLPTLDDIRDDSSETETRIILQLKSSKVDGQALMNQLFINTDLEKSLRVNLNMIGINGHPQVKNLYQILSEWLIFRKDIVRKRYLHRLEKLAIELNRIEGLLIAHDNLEEVIKIVRFDKNPKEALMKTFGLNEEQATYILDLRVRNLSKLEEDALRKQEKALLSEQRSINQLLASETKFNKQIKTELLAAKEKYGQERRSPIQYSEAAKSSVVVETTPEEPITVVISKLGWVRCGKGHDLNLDNLTYRTGDSYFMHCEGYLNQPVYFLDSTGKSYSILPGNLPSLRGYGEAITAHINLDDNASIISMVMGNPEQYLAIISSHGIGFICQVKDLETRVKSGKNFVTLKDNATILPPLFIPMEIDLTNKDSYDLLTCISNTGRVLSFNLIDLPIRNRGGRGVKVINLDSKKLESGEEFLRNIFITNADSSINIKNGSRSSSIDVNTLRKCKAERGNKGKPVIKGLNPKSVITIKQQPINKK